MVIEDMTTAELDGETFDLSTLAGRAKYARKMARLSAAEAARRIGISDNAIYLVETGVSRNIAPQNWAKYCAAYGVTEDWLRRGAGPPVADQMDDALYLRHRGITSEEGQREFQNYMDYLQHKEKHR